MNVTSIAPTETLRIVPGPPGPAINVFDFTVNRTRDGPQQFLKNYRGYLHAHAFSGYDGLYLPDPVGGQTAIMAEREMKQIATGRKNWYFVGSANGGRTAAVLYSFTSTCHRLEIDPWAYLQDVLTRLPELAPDKLTDLLPDVWSSYLNPSKK